MSKIEGLTIQPFRALRSACSYKEDTGRKIRVKTKSGQWKLIKYFKNLHLISKSGDFPTGLLSRVIDFLKANNIVHSLSDLRKRPVSTSKLFYATYPFTPYPEQLEIALIASERHQGIISCPTGFGKSIAMAMIINKLQLKTLIIVPNLTLKEQLKQDFKQYFGSLNNIQIENIDATILTKVKDFDCLIIDEAHHSAASTFQKLNAKCWNGIYHRYFFTATPFRSAPQEQILMEAITGKVIYEIDYQTAVDKGYIPKLEVYYFELPKESKVRLLSNYRAAYNHYIVNNELRNKLIAYITANLISQGRSIIVLTREIAHGNTIRDLLFEMGHDVPFAEGKNELKNEYIADFNNLTEKAIIGTVGVLGEGCNTKPAEFIILGGGGKATVQLSQNIGRGFRVFTYPDGSKKDSCKVIMFKDPNCKYALKHYLACVRFIKKTYGVTPIKLDI